MRIVHMTKLVGSKLLSGIWMDTWTKEQAAEVFGPNWDDRDAEAWLILLDGHMYRIVEDPSDGYRSYSRDIYEVTNMMPVNWWQQSEQVHVWFVNKWPGYGLDRKEWGEWWLPTWEPEQDDEDYYSTPERCELLVLVSKDTNKPVAMFGTANTDDYYPYFVAKFHPENMGINAGLIDITGRTQ